MVKGVFYVAAGPADLVSAHQAWQAGEHLPTEVSITFSEQIEEFCADIGAKAFFVSVHPDGRQLNEPDLTVVHRPKPAGRGWRYHLAEVRYGLWLWRTARRFGADVAILDSGATHYFVMELFRLSGMAVIPVLHNTLWPAGFRSRSLGTRLLEAANRRFWRRVPKAVIAVSPEAARQAAMMSRSRTYPILEIRAQFRKPFFQRIAPPPPHARRPFQVMFIGRVDRIKGVLDIPDMARRIEDRSPGLVRWVVCGRGADLDALREKVRALGLEGIVDARGWTSLDDLVTVYSESHAAIVPTTSAFIEGLAMTAAEAILAGRPLVTNPVVPALEILAPACMAARTNDPASHADAVFALATDPALYERLCAACPELAAPFYDRALGLRSILHQALDDPAQHPPVRTAAGT